MADRNVIAWKGDATENFIKQINDGTTSHDLALTHGITFYEGKGATDAQGITWDGRQSIEIVIPSVTDIIQDPVRMVGTVGANATITPNTYNPTTGAAKGDLLYITADCTFQGVACEAGDMAVYDGTAWRVIQGENQVTLAGTVDASNNIDVALGKTPVEVLDVEGKHLRLGINYADVLSKTAVYKNSVMNLPLANGTVNVAPMYIKLTQGDGATLDISTEKTINLPTSLASGAVTINEKVLQAADFSFVSGSYPTATLNSTSITVNATHNMGVGISTDTGDFVTAVTAISGVSFIPGTSDSNAIAYVASLSAVAGTSFVSGIHAYDETKDYGKTADLIIPGAVTVASENNTFATGFSDPGTSGDVISSITVGAVTIGASSADNVLLTGTTVNNSTFVSGITWGTAVSTADLGWFVNGLGTEGANGSVVTNVAVGAVTLVADNQGGTPAMVSASVNNHVLSFSTANFQTPVTISQASTTVSKADFTKAGVSLSGFDYDTNTFTYGGISQANTTASYRSLNTASVSLTQGAAVSYFFDKTQDHNYEAVMDYKSFNTTAAEVTKNAAVITTPTITATIPADSVVVGVTAGTLPTFTVNTATGTLTGSVPTALTSTAESWSAINVEKMAQVTIPGGYTLATGASTDTGAVEVAAAASNYAVANGQVTISANSFVTDVLVDGSAASQTQPSSQGV